MLVTHLPDVRYLCGFTGSNAALVLAGGRAVLFTDGRYTAQAKAEAAGTQGGDCGEACGGGGLRVDGGGGGAAVRVRCGAYDGGGAGDDAEGGVPAQGAAGDVCGGGVAGGEDAGGKGRGGDCEDAGGGAVWGASCLRGC